MSATIATPTAVLVDGPCPFLTCLDAGPHGHDICPECSAVRYGNAFCGTCVRTWDVSEETKRALLAAIEGQRGD